ncbi:hypothetical protein F4703DRAFT_1727277 [Phycomyces blakesleeanus]
MQIILVTLDYTGLLTNVEDLKEFLKDHKNVKKIVVDRFSINAEIEVSARETLVLDQVIINKLEYRRRPVQIFL